MGRPMKRQIQPPNPDGLCMCGCGEPTRIASVTRTDRGHLVGHPIPFVAGHHNRIRKGELAPRWKGGRYKMGSGYIAAYDSDRETHILEHRLIMERKLGRELAYEEHVHHINGIKDDNRLENLELLSQREHMQMHGRWKPSKASPET